MNLYMDGANKACSADRETLLRIFDKLHGVEGEIPGHHQGSLYVDGEFRFYSSNQHRLGTLLSNSYAQQTGKSIMLEERKKSSEPSKLDNERFRALLCLQKAYLLLLEQSSEL